MSSETSPDKKSDSASDSSVQPTEQFKNIDQLTKALQSFIEQIAKLIVTKNWVSLLLLIDAVLILFCFPGGILANFIQTTFAIELPEQYPIFFWVAVGGIFLTALVIAIRTIQKKPPSLPDFTERKAIKGLRAFTKEDAEIFALLERERDLRECLESITSKTFRIGILIGESGVGKSSFLQAGIIPQLAKSDSSHWGVYIRFSNQEPIASIYKALAEELQFSAAETNNHNLLEIFSLAVATADKPLILIFDQFEQFFVHFKQKQDREPFVNALKDWYCGDNPLPIKILISIREDLSGRLIDLQKALGYSLSPYEVFRLEKFTPESATKILQVIAQAEEIKFAEKFVNQLTAEELASREDGLISPVDLQVLAWTIERQNKELRAFNRTAFQKIGGIEGLMIRFLKTTLDARVIPRQREAAIKVLLAMTDLERNVRVGALTVEEIKENTKGTLNPAEIVEAVTWLASGGVRLITTIQQDGDVRYELAHERLIPALREEARRKLTSADRANQLLNRRVNEWLGNQKSNRYLFNWQELRLFQQQKPYLVWGANQIHKENLLKRSWQKLTRQLIAMAMVLVLGLLGIGWWHTPWGQIQQVRWELAGLSQRVSDEYKGKAALAFFKDERFNQALAITDSIKSSSDRTRVLRAIAQTSWQLENFPQAREYLDKAFTAAQQIADLSDRANALIAISETIGQLENFPQAGEYLDKAFTAAQQIDNSYYRAEVLIAITETYGQLENFPQATEYLDKAFTAAQQIDYSSDRAWVLTAIAETYGQLENFPQATEYLDKAFTAAQQIDNSSDRAEVLIAIAQTYGQLENFPQAGEYLDKAYTAAQQIDNSSHRAWF